MTECVGIAFLKHAAFRGIEVEPHVTVISISSWGAIEEKQKRNRKDAPSNGHGVVTVIPANYGTYAFTKCVFQYSRQ